MRIRNIKLINFRNYDNLILEFSKNINIIIGNNGEGKTNILESIYVLALTKSNRFGKDDDLIKFSKDSFFIEGMVEEGEILRKFNVSLNNNHKKVMINDKEIRRIASYISHFCVISFAPCDLEIVKGTPSIRRDFFNISISQINSNYINNLNEYNAILKMRNDFIKTLLHNDKLDYKYLSIINDKLVIVAEIIYEYRFRYISLINQYIEKIFYKLTSLHGLKVVYDNSVGITSYDKLTFQNLYIKRLEKNYHQDLMVGSTTIGPHRDDYKFYLEDKDMRLFASQGQQRLAVIALKIAEISVFKQYKNDYPVLLLDDIFSEIDVKKRNKIIKYLKNDIQTIITTTDILNIDKSLLMNAKIFTIKNNKITIKGGIRNGRGKGKC